MKIDHSHAHPIGMYLRTFAALLLLMVLTVAMAFVHVGPEGTSVFNNLIAMAIAVTKAVLVVLFVVSNTAPVALGLWPFDARIVLPLAVAVLAVAAIAFLFGAAIAWFACLPYRTRARRLDRSVEVLQAVFRKAVSRRGFPTSPEPL